MFWSLAGILLWVGGWWFTGRLFPAYRKAVYYESQEQRRRHPEAPPAPHFGPALLMLFDFGLLLSGIRGLTELFRAIWADRGWQVLEPLETDGFSESLARLAPYAVLILVFAVRSACMLHAFYNDQLRSAGNIREPLTMHPERLRALWNRMRPPSRALLVLAFSLSALAPIAGWFEWRPWRNSSLGSVLVLLIPVMTGILAMLPSIRVLRENALRPVRSDREKVSPEKASVP